MDPCPHRGRGQQLLVVRTACTGGICENLVYTMSRRWVGSEFPTSEYVQETIAFVHNCSICDHHGQSQCRKACFCSVDKCLGKEVPRENAHRWRRFSTTSHGSCVSMSRFILRSSSCRRATPKGGESGVMGSQLKISLDWHHCLEVWRPPLRCSSCPFPRIHRHIKITNSLCKRRHR